jgi:hypothetical protein
VTLIAPQGVVTPAGVMPRLKQFRVVGVFEVGMYEYDSGLALIHLADAQRAVPHGGPRLRRAPEARRPVRRAAVARAAGTVWPINAFISDWTRSHANFFRAVQIEKNMMFIILLADRRRRRVQHRVHAGHGGDRQAGRHRHPAHARRQPGQHHGGVHRAGRADRLHRPRLGRRRRRRAGAQRRCGRAGSSSACSARSSSPRRCITFPNLPSELQWSDVTTIIGVAFVLTLAGDDLSELARLAGQSGGGAAL